MGRQVSGVPLLILWFITLVLALFAISLIIPELIKVEGLNFSVSHSSKNVFDETDLFVNDDTRQLLVSAKVKAGDARVLVIDNFLLRYGSPMIGHGKDFIAAADYYGLDWRLLPAIAFQESNLGKKIPSGSYNPFGWAIYTGKKSGVYFDSWSHSIFTVAAGVKKNYLDNGLATPETIAVRYTEDASPTWIFSVKTAMQELSSQVY